MKQLVILLLWCGLTWGQFLGFDLDDDSFEFDSPEDQRPRFRSSNTRTRSHTRRFNTDEDDSDENSISRRFDIDSDERFGGSFRSSSFGRNNFGRNNFGRNNFGSNFRNNQGRNTQSRNTHARNTQSRNTHARNTHARNTQSRNTHGRSTPQHFRNINFDDSFEDSFERFGGSRSNRVNGFRNSNQNNFFSRPSFRSQNSAFRQQNSAFRSQNSGRSKPLIIDSVEDLFEDLFDDDLSDRLRAQKTLAALGHRNIGRTSGRSNNFFNRQTSNGPVTSFTTRLGSDRVTGGRPLSAIRSPPPRRPSVSTPRHQQSHSQTSNRAKNGLSHFTVPQHSHFTIPTHANRKSKKRSFDKGLNSSTKNKKPNRFSSFGNTFKSKPSSKSSFNSKKTFSSKNSGVPLRRKTTKTTSKLPQKSSFGGSKKSSFASSKKSKSNFANAISKSSPFSSSKRSLFSPSFNWPGGNGYYVSMTTGNSKPVSYFVKYDD